MLRLKVGTVPPEQRKGRNSTSSDASSSTVFARLGSTASLTGPQRPLPGRPSPGGSPNDMSAERRPGALPGRLDVSNLVGGWTT